MRILPPMGIVARKTAQMPLGKPLVTQLLPIFPINVRLRVRVGDPRADGEYDHTGKLTAGGWRQSGKRRSSPAWGAAKGLCQMAPQTHVQRRDRWMRIRWWIILRRSPLWDWVNQRSLARNQKSVLLGVSLLLACAHFVASDFHGACPRGIITGESYRQTCHDRLTTGFIPDGGRLCFRSVVACQLSPHWHRASGSGCRRLRLRCSV